MSTRAVLGAARQRLQAVVAIAAPGAGDPHAALGRLDVAQQQPGAHRIGELQNTPQRRVYYIVLAIGIGQATGEVEQAVEQRIGACQLVVLGLQFMVEAHALFVGGNQQVEDLLAAGGDEMPFTVEYHLHAHLYPFVATKLKIDQKVADARHQVLLVIGLDDKVVGATSQAMHHIAGIGQAGDQNHRNGLGTRAGLELATEFVAIHLRHHDIADDDVRQPLFSQRQGFDPVARHAHLATGRLEQILQLGGLGRAVFGD